MPSKTPKTQSTTSSTSLNERFSILGDKHKNRLQQRGGAQGSSQRSRGSFKRRTFSSGSGQTVVKLNPLGPQSQIRRERRGRGGLLSRLIQVRPRRRVGGGVKDIQQTTTGIVPNNNGVRGGRSRRGRGSRGRGGSNRTEWKRKTTLQHLDQELEHYMDVDNEPQGGNPQGRGGRGRRRGGRGRGRGKKVLVTHDQLDKDLDMYMQAKQ